MSLSVRAAAWETPDAPALIFDRESVSFAALATYVEARVAELKDRDPAVPFPLCATPTFEALVTLYACLDAAIPVGLLHPRWPESVQAAQRERLLRMRSLAGPGASAPLAFLFTSGTTGESKAVELSRGAFIAAAAAHARAQGWRADDRWLLALPFAHVGGLSVLIRCLLARKPVVVFGSRPFEPEAIVATSQDSHVTLLSLVPAQLERLLEVTKRPPRHLRLLLLGGSAASPRLLARAAAAGWPVLQTYGMTETCAQIASGNPATALTGVALRISRGIAEGIIEVRSPTLLTAYHDATGCHSPLDAEGWFRTGDLGVLDDAGRLSVLGRADDIIVTGGEKVNPVEVERVLEQIPGVSEACVVGLPDSTWGQVVAAALVARLRPTPETVDEWLTAALAGYQRPRNLIFVDSLPRTPAGKLDRRVTAELFSSLPPGA